MRPARYLSNIQLSNSRKVRPVKQKCSAGTALLQAYKKMLMISSEEVILIEKKMLQDFWISGFQNIHSLL